MTSHDASRGTRALVAMVVAFLCALVQVAGQDGALVAVVGKFLDSSEAEFQPGCKELILSASQQSVVAVSGTCRWSRDSPGIGGYKLVSKDISTSSFDKQVFFETYADSECTSPLNNVLLANLTIQSLDFISETEDLEGTFYSLSQEGGDVPSTLFATLFTWQDTCDTKSNDDFYRVYVTDVGTDESSVGDFARLAVRPVEVAILSSTATTEVTCEDEVSEEWADGFVTTNDFVFFGDFFSGFYNSRLPTRCTTLTVNGEDLSVVVLCDPDDPENPVPTDVRVYEGPTCNEEGGKRKDATIAKITTENSCAFVESFEAPLLRVRCLEAPKLATPTVAPTSSPRTPTSAPKSTRETATPTSAPKSTRETATPTSSPAMPTSAPKTPTSAPKTLVISNSGGDRNSASEAREDRNGAAIALVPVVFVMGAVLYLLVTRRNPARKPADSDSDLDSDEQAPGLSRRLPPNSKVSRTAGMAMMGYSMTLLKVKTPGAKARTRAKVGDAYDEEDEEDDEDDDEERKSPEDGDLEAALGRNFVIGDAQQLALGKLIGKGAHGRVYEGTFQGSAVAVKEYVGGRSKESFMREFRNLRKLQHPNVIRLYGILNEDTASGRNAHARRMLVMELAPFNLATFVNDAAAAPFQEGVTAVALLQWLQQICSGLSFVHSKGLIHFDIKPENLLLDAAYNVKIGDLGISRSTQSVRHAPSTTDQEGGTPAYAAPELLTGSRESLSSAVDVYAFGIVMWKLLHRAQPSHPPTWTVMQVLRNAEEGYRPDIADSVPDTLRSIVHASWSQVAGERPTFDHLRENFHALLGSRSVNIANSSFSHRAPFELGQKVLVWAPLKNSFRFVANLASNGTNDAIANQFVYRITNPTDGTAEAVLSDNLLLDIDLSNEL